MSVGLDTDVERLLLRPSSIDLGTLGVVEGVGGKEIGCCLRRGGGTLGDIGAASAVLDGEPELIEKGLVLILGREGGA